MSSQGQNSNWNNYKNVMHWSKLKYAQMTVKEFSVAKNDSESNLNFQLLRNRLLGVLKKKGVVYYNVDTLQEAHELTTTEPFECIRYKEDDNIILILDKRNTLFVRKKGSINKFLNIIYKVKMFLILEGVIFYVTFKNNVYKCVCVDDAYETFYIEQSYPVLAIGHRNSIFHYMAQNGNKINIYALLGDTLRLVSLDASSREQIEALNRYNFANNMDWSDRYGSVSILERNVHEYPFLKNIQLVHIYGTVLFAAYEPGILRMFHSLHNFTLFELLKSEPLKVYFVLEPHKGITNCKILDIDVINDIYSYTVLVALPHKILSIKFTCDSTCEQLRICNKKSSSDNVLPTHSGNVSVVNPGNEELSINCEEPSTSEGIPSTNNMQQSLISEEPKIQFEEKSTTGDHQPMDYEETAVSNRAADASSEHSQSSEPLAKIAKKED